ncbi:MAG: anaerobic ribonucleoside-triphosphate reductase activating protein [Flavobacteriaceae bacterium]|jgi:anaerobic ribonucleoside-triphosphate reductase activating protein|nr:anaerobic ribonucleoside-triphosphate reductase activating protein [Flavobacteriaceae bacterium]MBT6705766.1 anaerobic ribonucleoside-triphosphate reductase activating protein [Flavobacteriaceae bacterium]
MFYYDFQVVLQEVPGEISLCFYISGCSLHCEGCHSPFLWKEGNGSILTVDTYKSILNQYKNLATCVLFMGGEWHQSKLISMLQLAKSHHYKTCLYTGENSISEDLKTHLTFLKTGKWQQDLGGLESSVTNQIFTKVPTNQNLNYLFSKN